MSNAMFNSLPAVLKAVGVDALVLDTYLFYAELLPISLGMPYAAATQPRSKLIEF